MPNLRVPLLTGILRFVAGLFDPPRPRRFPRRCLWCGRPIDPPDQPGDYCSARCEQEADDARTW